MTRRKWGTGSLYQRKDGRWVLQTQESGSRKYSYGRTPDEAISNHGRTPKPRPTRIPFVIWQHDRTQDAQTAKRRREFATEVAEAVIREAVRVGWSEPYLARVMVAQLAPGRIRRRITGPCAYCDSWLANSVDHIVPTVSGGTDDPKNLVSCCYSCNSAKRHRTPSQWRVPA